MGLLSLVEERVSSWVVSRVARSLDREVKRFHERALSDDYRFLFLDAVVLRQRG